MLALHLGLRYLLRRRTAWLAFAAVTLTVMVSVAVMGVTQGFIDVMAKQVRANEADLTVEAWSDEEGMADTPVVRQQLGEQPGILGVAPFVTGYAMATPQHAVRPATAFNGSFPCLFTAIDWQADWNLGRLPEACLHRTPDLDLSLPRLAPEQRGTGFLTPSWRAHLVLWSGNLIPGCGLLPLPPGPVPTPGAVAGQELAYLNGLLPGNAKLPGTSVTLVAATGTGGAGGKVRFEISDTIGTGIYEVDKLNLLLPLGMGQRLADLHAKPSRPALVSGVHARATPDSNLKAVAAGLSQATNRRVTTWDQRRAHLAKGLVQQRNLIGFVMILVQALVVFIAYAVFSTLVAEKRHDIGVLLGIGVTPSRIAGAFLITGVICCVAGGLVGWGLGWIVLSLINPFSQWTGIYLFPQDFFYSADTPVSYDPLIPLLCLALVSLVGLIAAALPAWRAARTDPVATLREHG